MVIRRYTVEELEALMNDHSWFVRTRKFRGLSQRAAATEAGVPFSLVHQFEANRYRQPSLPNFLKLIRWAEQL